MEDTNILMMRVLKIHFKDRLQILDYALKELKEYSSKEASTQSEYNDITATLNGMLNDLPEDILKYFLTLIPLPKYKENFAKNYYDAEDIRTVLNNYVNRDVPALVITKDVETPKVERKTRSSASSASAAKSGCSRGAVSIKRKPRARKRPARASKTPQECKKLLEICAEYVVKNHAGMNQKYHSKNEEVWRLLKDSNRFSAEELNKLYEIGRDLNKKLKWLRLLDAEEITDEIILDSYYDENILIRESEIRHLLTEDPFVVSEELQKSIMQFVSIE